MSYKRALIRALDRPGGRFLLGNIATHCVRRIAGADMEIAYIDGLWTHRVGPNFFPDSLRFDYVCADFEIWSTQIERYTSDTREYWLQHYRPQKGDVVVDVGAGRGEDVLTFSRAVGDTGRVIAVEPHPTSFAILKHFCRLNRLANVTPVNLAVMDKPGAVRMAEWESLWIGNAVDTSNRSTAAIEVCADTLDNICRAQAVGEIAFLKMNIEGAEREALLGATSMMSRVRQICVACHDFRSERGHGEQFRTRAFVHRFLTERGFVVASRANDPRDYVRDHVFGLRCASTPQNAGGTQSNAERS
jgi:FkbM family methyltransferase